jgi:hypothetical protein
MALGKAAFMPWNWQKLNIDFFMLSGLAAFQPLPANHDHVVLQGVFQVLRDSCRC